MKRLQKRKSSQIVNLIPNPYLEKREPSPGETQVKHGSWFLSFLRFLNFKLKSEEQKAAEIIGSAISRELRKWRKT